MKCITLSALAVMCLCLSSCITKRTITQNGRPISEDYIVKPPTVKGTLSVMGAASRLGR